VSRRLAFLCGEAITKESLRNYLRSLTPPCPLLSSLSHIIHDRSAAHPFPFRSMRWSPMHLRKSFLPPRLFLCLHVPPLLIRAMNFSLHHSARGTGIFPLSILPSGPHPKALDLSSLERALIIGISFLNVGACPFLLYSFLLQFC